MMTRALVKAASLFSCLGVLAPGIAWAAEGDTTTVYITGTLVDAPECTVNASNQLSVSFGDDVITYQVDGQNYKKQIVYTLTCTGLADQGLTMTLNGTPSGFDNTLFKTSNDGLGIRITGNDKQVSPGGAIGFAYTSQPVLFAVPVAKDAATLGTGPFNGTATMVVTYQ
ncbi:fimbrial protein [Enterobacter quasiroggenkampii]|uniref:fimbrial protein n=1 Tax=Enterobacter quasiroggenkampii TaxID=2497436 RepID=UPI002006C8DE|nr:fimbrial protein [Enterobacter quasiroggenkampii]MCK7310385.1 fimbrial protein [Enterobacter quasiroggenkampii]